MNSLTPKASRRPQPPSCCPDTAARPSLSFETGLRQVSRPCPAKSRCGSSPPGAAAAENRADRVSGREYRKALRAAEMAAWDQFAPGVKPASPAPLWRAAAKAADSRNEQILFALLAAIALCATVFHLMATARSMTAWQAFQAFVERLVS